MKIGILTHCLATNYGANLQALSTAYYLRNHGYEPFFFNWNVYLDEVNSKMIHEQVSMHTSILQRHSFEVSEPCISSNDFRKVILEKEIRNIIVGSDAVLTVKPFLDSISISRKGIKWGPPADYTFPNPFWAVFLDGFEYDVKTFLMSPSCQSSNYKMLSRWIKRKMSYQLNNFSFLSARDTYTQQMICDIAHINPLSVPITPDPVWNFNENVGMLIPTKNELLAKYGVETDNYILVSFYPERIKKTNILKELEMEASKRGYYLYFIPMPQDNTEKDIRMISLPIDSLDYYALIKYSKGYIGNNMHPVICAIHNQVPFVSIDQHGKWYLHGIFQDASSSKVYDLLSRFDLNDHRINQVDLKKISSRSIFDLLVTTDINKLGHMNSILGEEYHNMMKKITSQFL